MAGRIALRGERALQILCDNPAYAADVENPSPSEFRVVGRAIWAGGLLIYKRYPYIEEVSAAYRFDGSSNCNCMARSHLPRHDLTRLHNADLA